MMFSIYCDGGARGNPGPAAVGIVVQNETGMVIHAFGKTIGIATNNVAEYTAVIEALIWMRKNQNPKAIHFFLDSKLVVSQLNGLYKIKNANLRQLLLRIRQVEASLGGNISYEHIPREQNQEADKFVNEALDSRQ